jgi:hypothetical protein
VCTDQTVQRYNSLSVWQATVAALHGNVAESEQALAAVIVGDPLSHGVNKCMLVLLQAFTR